MVLISLGIAVVTLVLLGMRSFGYEQEGFRPRAIGLNPRPPADPPVHVSCDAVISEVFHSSGPTCHLMAREKVPGLVIQSLVVGVLALAILVGLSWSAWHRPPNQPAQDSSPQIAAQLERLAELRRSGDLSDEEFAAAKRSLLG